MMMREYISRFSLGRADEEALHQYLRNHFGAKNPAQRTSDLSAWGRIIDYAAQNSVSAAINQFLCPKHPIQFQAPDAVTIEIYPSFAGEIPIIFAANTADFEALHTNIIHKGKRVPQIEQIGAAFIYGQSTRLILLSAKPYSNVPAEAFGLEPEEWIRKSILIRRSHESTHFYTKTIFDIACNHLHDELIADFIGLYDAFGTYRAQWFIRFMGDPSENTGRMSVYVRGLTPPAVDALREITADAAEQLEIWASGKECQSMSRIQRIDRLCQCDFIDIAAGKINQTVGGDLHE